MDEPAVDLETEFDGPGWLVDPLAPRDHLDVLERSELLVPVVGSGVTIPAGYPSGASVRETLVEIGVTRGVNRAYLDYEDPRRIADVLLEHDAISRGDLLERVASLFSHEPKGSSPTIDALLRAQSRLIVTFNYDRAFEFRANELGIACDELVLARDIDKALAALSAESPRERLVVVHAHGVATDPATLVLDAHGYSQLINGPQVEFFLKALMLQHRLVFIGTRLDELHILHSLIALRTVKKRHLLVCTESRMPEFTTELAPSTYLVLIRGYPNGKDAHRELTDFVETFALPPDAGEPVESTAPTGPRFPRVTALRPPEYIETMLVETHDPDEDEFSASFLAALGTRSPLSLEQIAVVGTRTLIEGRPGSGKSTLLHEIGLRQPKDVVPLQLHAPRLDLVGDPNLLLPRWFDVGTSFSETEVRNADRLATGVFHFLIDGLDEVAYDRQADAARRIVEVAAVNPTHTFTVASRRVPALEAFARPEWTRVLLAPAGNWQEKYLGARDVTWSDLVQAAPLLGDLRGLMELPFFLSHTVDLYRDGKLEGAHDMLGLVRRLVDAALVEAEKTLPRDEVRLWLRQLALAMALSGRTDISLNELAESLPDRLSDGNPAGVAERLVTARLLRSVGDDRYGFVHRIFGEALATEAMIQLDPEESGILEVAAPVISDRRRGLRSDWLVPMTLLAAASEPWRRALAERDELAAARAVPLDATLEERKAAARLIWETYASWRVWISDHARISIVDDQEVLARLLTTEGLGALQDEIRGALGGADRETIGNAIKVLARVGDRSIELDLRRILEKDEDYVLRRFAAIAARDLKLDSLFFLVAHRAINSADSTEAQDATYAAIDLARRDDLLPFALRAAEHRSEAGSILAYWVQGRISERDELAILRARAAHGDEALSMDRKRVVKLVTSLDVDAAAAEDALFIAASWRVADDVMLQIARKFPASAAKAVVEAVGAGAAYGFELGWLLNEIDLQELKDAGAPAELVADKERFDDWRRGRADDG